MTVRKGIITYGELTSPEAAEARDAGALLLLPVGALEQHGNGLPLATDTIRADHVAESVAATLESEAFVLPSLPYGVSPHHTPLPGTVTIPPTLFVEHVTAIVTSLAASGWTRFLVISGHGGNSAALGLVQQTLLGTYPDLLFAWTPVSAVAARSNAALSRTQVSGHSGESETSQVLAIDESLVLTDALTPGATRLDDLSPRARLSRTARPSIAVTFDQYAANGVLGDPTTATAADGNAILEEVTEVLVGYARELLAL